MNVLRSFLTGIVRPAVGSSLLNTSVIRTVTQKPPGKRPDLIKKPLAMAPTFVPYHLRPRSPNIKKATGRKRMHPYPQPKVNWIRDMTIPRTSVLSYHPVTNHHWHDFRMLRDVKRRAYVQRDSRVRNRLKSLLRTTLLPSEFREYVREDIVKLPRDSNFIRIVNRCVVTSRDKATLLRYRMSRIVWRNLADHNQISGVMRARWGKKWDDRYYRDIDPDLHDTLRAVDPINARNVERYYTVAEDGITGGYRPPLQSLYNENVFKTERFIYPKPVTYPPPIIERKLKGKARPKKL